MVAGPTLLPRLLTIIRQDRIIIRGTSLVAEAQVASEAAAEEDTIAAEDGKTASAIIYYVSYYVALPTATADSISINTW